MDLNDSTIKFAMSLPYGSRVQDPNVIGDILDEVGGVTEDGVDSAVDDISDALDLTDEETAWLRHRVRREVLSSDG